MAGAAFAYGKAGAGVANINAAIAKAGAGSNISVVTNKRFDPTHPEFSSSANNAKFDTLTRFWMVFGDVPTPPTTLAAVIPAVFGTGAEAKARVQLYYRSSVTRSSSATIRVPNVGRVTFESISHNALEARTTTGVAIRRALGTFLRSVVDGTQVDKTNSHKVLSLGGPSESYRFAFYGDKYWLY